VTAPVTGGSRPDIATAARVVVKVGSSSLTTAAGEIADEAAWSRWD
jgi:glutamate 5-kinase